MKKINKIFKTSLLTVALGCGTMLTSCTDFLTIYPTNSVIHENFWQTAEDVNGMLATCYQRLQSSAAIERMIVWGDLRGDQIAVRNNSSNTYKYIVEANLQDNNTYCSWAEFYQAINDANMVLEFAPEVVERDPDFTQGDLDISVNLLRDRVGMPHMNMAEANANPDWYLKSEEYGYRNVSGQNEGVILEIRRERAIELFQEGFRWDDLMRWKEGLCINQDMHGQYFPGLGEYDLTGDKKADIVIYEGKKPADKAGVAAFEVGVLTGVMLTDGTKGYIDPQPQENPANAHVFDESRDYLYGIPTTERSLNPNLTQNPNWADGLEETETEE